MKEKIRENKTLLILFFVYTIIFFIVSRYIMYFLPFIISLILCAAMKPLYDHLKRKFRFKPAFCATSITLIIFSVAGAMIGFVIYLIISELVSLYREHRELFDLSSLWRNLYSKLLTPENFSKLSGFAVNTAMAVPIAITFVVITFALCVYFLNNISRLRKAALNRFSFGDKLCAVIDSAYAIFRRFLRSYMILYLITFLEAAFIFWLLKIDYPLVFAFITAVADLLPIIGPGSVYIPFSVIFILNENYINGITLLIFFVITIIIRQITEPKIVSDSVKLSPLLVLSALYFSVVSMNFWVLIYIISSALIYKIFIQARVINPLLKKESPTLKKESL